MILNLPARGLDLRLQVSDIFVQRTELGIGFIGLGARKLALESWLWPKARIIMGFTKLT